jgi:hypothetical protein
MMLAALAFALLAACGGDDDDDVDDAPRFDPDRADELAHAALVGTADLPGAGWDVTAEDAFDDSEDDDEFLEFAEQEESCQHIADLAALGGVMGDDDAEELPLARAKVEFQRNAGPLDMPSSVEVEIEIEETVGDIQGGWGIISSILGADETRECFAALMSAVMVEESDGLFEVSLESIDPPAEAPGNGVALAFRMEIEINGLATLEAVMGLYMWPYSNAGVQVMILGSEDDLEADDFAAILDSVDKTVRAAAE